jgi:hypothetical protein
MIWLYLRYLFVDGEASNFHPGKTKLPITLNVVLSLISPKTLSSLLATRS